MDAIKKKITMLKEDNETMQEEIERLQEQVQHIQRFTTLFLSETCWWIW